MKIFSRVITSYWGIYGVLALLWIVGCIVAPAFRTVDNVSNVIVKAATLAMVSIGQTFVLLTANFDLSVGGIVGLSTAIASCTMEQNLLLGVVLVLVVGTAIGFVNGVGVAKFGVNSVIMTLGSLSIAQGIGLYLRPYPGGMVPLSYIDFFAISVYGIPVVALGLILVVATVCILVLERRSFGRHIYIVGGSEDSAIRAGISVSRIRIAVFSISGFLAAIGGLFMTSIIGSGDSLVGESYMFQSFTAALLGGTAITGGEGSVKGTLGAVFIIASLGSLFNLVGINTWYQNIFLGVLLIAVLTSKLIYDRLQVERVHYAADMA
ncbi:MAG: ABC transporter permease [Desulfobacterales bacterium]|nr:MAG: ABC transporter permease [Desulfobacterales bacterium]